MFKENRLTKSRDKISKKLSKFPSSTASTRKRTILAEKQNSVCEFESPSQSKNRFRSSPDSSVSEFDTDKTYTGTPNINRRFSLKERKSKRARPTVLPSPTFITGSKNQNISFASQLNMSSFESSQRKKPKEKSRRSRSEEASSNIVTLGKKEN